jgi:alkylhydroperoxidase family enzyme
MTDQATPDAAMKIDPAGIEIPAGKNPIFYVWGEMVPGIGVAASTFAQSVYEHSTLGLREFEAARLRIAQINGCLFCQDWRTERDGEKVPEGFDEQVTAPVRSTIAPAWPPSTPSGSPPITTTSTPTSGPG